MRVEFKPYLLVILAIIAFDQLTKVYIYCTLVPGDTKQILGDFLRFTFVYNPGGAFGITIGNFWIYTFLSTIAIAVVIYYFIKVPHAEKIAKYCLATVVGGALGNFIDRVAYGQVIDFIDVNIFDITIPSFGLFGMTFGGYQINRWYIFNIADAAISVGLIAFIMYLLIVDKLGHELLKSPGEQETENGRSDYKINSTGD